MKKFPYLILSMLLALGVLAACDEKDTTIGSALVTDNLQIVMDSSFTLTGGSVENGSVQSRTVMQLIGRLDAKGFGRLESEIVTQFMPGMVMETDKFTADDIDSVKLVMRMNNGAYTGDSLAPMGLKVYPLKKSLPSPIYSNFDPEGYYDPAEVWGSATYTATALGQPDTIYRAKSRAIEVMLPRSFAVDIYNQMARSPETFQTPQSFASWFPGLYITNTFGSGRVCRIEKSYITMFYHAKSKSEASGKDTTIYYANTFLAVTPEIVTDNVIDYEMAEELRARALAGEALIVAPAGYDVDITFPAREVIDYYHANAGKMAMINALSMEIPVEEIANDYGILPPTHLLLVKKSQAKEFFAKNMINDGVNSFYAVYDATNHSYVFSEMRAYINDLLSKDSISDEDVEFTLTPVTINTESSSSAYNPTSIVTGIVPYITNPVMARLDLKAAKIKLTFSKQTL